MEGEGERGSLIPIPGICITPSCLEREKSSYINISHFLYLTQAEGETNKGKCGVKEKLQNKERMLKRT
jgi:hypothetical protein